MQTTTGRQQNLLVDNKTNNIMGRDNLRKLGITLTARKNEGKKMLHITDNTTETNIIKWILKKYPKLCTRLGKSKNHIAKPSMKENFKPVQQKGRRVPLHLLDKVEAELKKLIQDKQIIKLDKCSDEHFISPVVITVKHDKSVKIALDSKKLNDVIHKNKYQMQSIDHLIDEVATYISERKQNPGEFFFSKIDLKYAYSQIPLDPNIQKHCNFSILGGKATGTYRFINGFYALTDMPATFQKTMDKTLESINTKFAFLDDILIITKGTLTEHEQELDKVLNLLDKENLAIKLQKCEFPKAELIWLGFKIHPNGIIPTKQKCDSISKLEIPKTLKQLRSFMGCIHHLIKFTPNLARLSEPLRPLLSKSNLKPQNKLDWKPIHTDAFKKIKEAIKAITENKLFDVNRSTRVRCDASKKGLGACLEQKVDAEWHPIAYASRFLNNLEQRYSTNELELLAVVWALEHFKYYLYGAQFTLQTDHQALLSALKENRGNKTYQSRLTRWVDRLLPFHFSVEHIPGKNMGFADYLSRHPSSDPPTPSDRDKNFLINTIEEIKHALLRNNLAPIGAINTTSHLSRNNDVINAKHSRTNKNSALCHFPRYIQLPSSLHKLNTQFKQFNSNKNLVAITTRANPTNDTFKVTIKRRPRAPNKNLIHMENPSGKSAISVATQTDTTSNKGRGLDPLDSGKHEPLFTTYDETPTPLYRENHNRVFNEEFIAQVSKKELNPIIEFVKNGRVGQIKSHKPNLLPHQKRLIRLSDRMPHL